MEIKVNNEIIITNINEETKKYIKNKLIFNNPDYINALRMNRWTGNIDEKIYLFRRNGNEIVVPFGCLSDIWKLGVEKYELEFPLFKDNNLKGNINLYDYQKSALNALKKGKNGVLEGACGCGKTQIGLQLIKEIGGKALWLTHTHDLLKQSKERAEQYFEGDFGTITEGKVNIGKDITFATVQTMSKLDPKIYRNEFDMVVCDECFVEGTKIATKKGYKNIEDIKCGDEVLSYNHNKKKAEYRKVKNLFVKSSSNLYTLKTKYDEIKATGNHPIFTQNGYKRMEEIKDGEYVLQILWKRNKDGRNDKRSLGICKKEGLCVLQSVLRDELFKLQQSSVQTKTRENENEQSYVSPREYRQDDENKRIEWEFAPTNKKSWWEWQNSANTAISSERIKKSWNRVCDGVCCQNTQDERTKALLSKLLQDRYCDTKQENCDRIGWAEPQWKNSKRKRYKEKFILKWARLESVEIQEQRDQRVFNFEVEGNNNYFANNILVHNCHKISCGTYARMKMFYKVISNINCRYKYGLSATLTRSDGLIGSVYACVGNKLYSIKEADIGDKIIKAQHEKVNVNIRYDYEDYCDTDGTLDYNKLIDTLSNDFERNEIIIDKVKEMAEKGKKQLILCSRISQVETLGRRLKVENIDYICISSKTKQKDRDYSHKVIVATYQLAKEGLDIVDLDIVHLATPQKDKATVKQSVGRCERNYDGKERPIALDYVDIFIPYCVKCYKKRVSILK